MARQPRPNIKLNVTTKPDARLPKPGRKERPDIEWAIKGELFMNCSCTVFCPCVVSLGKHPPTEGHCHAWLAIRIDSGHYGTIDLSGIDLCLLADIPGRMGEGGWKVAVYVDDSASYPAYDAILKIISGKAGGTTGVLKYLVSDILGAERTPVMIEQDGPRRRIMVGKKIQGEIEQVLGVENKPVEIRNPKYWIGPEIYVAQGIMSRVRALGRVWDFGGKSAEICPLDWSGPGR